MDWWIIFSKLYYKHKNTQLYKHDISFKFKKYHYKVV